MEDILKSKLILPCGKTLKNRICKSALTERIAEGSNLVNQKHLNLYEKWAEGNVGTVLTGNVQVDKRYLESAGNVAIEKSNYKDQIELLKKWTEVGTKNNTNLWMQISHAGRQTPGDLNMKPVAPSDVGLKIPGRKYGIPKPLTNEEIEDVIERFIFTAKVAHDTGFTGIQIHSAHGYLMSEFLSPDINKRDDEWGGSLENRSRILLRIINGCRKALGDNYPISVKLNSADFQKGGFSAEDSSKVASMLSEAKIDLLEISGGTYEQPRLLGLDTVSINPKRSEIRKESTIAREAYFLAYTEEIKKVIDIPLMVTGGFRSRLAMETAINQGACEIVGIGRPLCSDPLSVKKLLDRSIDVLPTFEKTLSIGPGWLSQRSPFRLIQALNAFGIQSWFYSQIRRISEGLSPDLSLNPFKAFRTDGKIDKETVNAYKLYNKS
ncbi:MAG: NADH:flavin oxidoreductase [Gammaproteobacteria bacterium TMED222]|nr:MAG: NADH:flavin oxidoreductase [Gammaproteobacteria bacterium TMED222]RZO97803.1 MAG: NADH:flavin oxidoreductase [Gammaproteobacteria bacterium]